jgi:cell division protein FtsN
MLQAGAMKNKDSAQALRRRLEKEGFRTKLLRIEGKGNEPDLYKIRIGPHGSREEAVKAMREIQSAFKVDVFLLKD